MDGRMKETRQRVSKFVKNFVAALGHCAMEEGELIAPALLLVAALGLICLLLSLAQVGYEMVWHPNSTNVAARLAQLSIFPGQ